MCGPSSMVWPVYGTSVLCMRKDGNNFGNCKLDSSSSIYHPGYSTIIYIVVFHLFRHRVSVLEVVVQVTCSVASGGVSGLWQYSSCLDGKVSQIAAQCEKGYHPRLRTLLQQGALCQFDSGGRCRGVGKCELVDMRTAKLVRQRKSDICWICVLVSWCLCHSRLAARVCTSLWPQAFTQSRNQTLTNENPV